MGREKEFLVTWIYLYSLMDDLCFTVRQLYNLLVLCGYVKIWTTSPFSGLSGVYKNLLTLKALIVRSLFKLKGISICMGLTLFNFMYPFIAIRLLSVS